MTQNKVPMVTAVDVHIIGFLYLNCAADACCGVKGESADTCLSGWNSEKTIAAAGLRFHNVDPSHSLYQLVARLTTPVTAILT